MLNRCTSNSDTISIVRDKEIDEEFQIYPNPGRKKYTLKLATLPDEDLEIVVFNAVGYPIETMKNDHQSVSLTYSINIEKEAAGVPPNR